MANSRIIEEIKNRVIMDIIEDPEIVDAIDSPDKDTVGWSPRYMIDCPDTIEKGFTPLLFKYFKNTKMITKSITFITVIVNINGVYSNNDLFQNVSVQIQIVTNDTHMRIDNAAIPMNRNDYLSILLDNKFNGADIGYGTLQLNTNIETIYNEDYNCRILTFRTLDLNDNLCCDNGYTE